MARLLLHSANELFICAGQSNADGAGLTAADLPSNLQTPTSQIRIWTGSGFETLENGHNNDISLATQHWGPEAEFSRRWAAAHTNKCFLVKYAVDGTTLATDPGSDWNPSNAELFTTLENYVNAAKAALGRNTKVSALLWMQGESDAQNSSYAAAYQTNLTAFFAAVRSRLGDANTKILIGRISDSTAWTFRSSVRSAQAACVAADEKTALIDTDSYPLQGDNQHYTAAGQVSLGADMYSAYSAF